MPALLRWAWKQYSGLPQDEVESLMHQVLGEICVAHGRYDPNRSKFTTYVINLYKLRIRDLFHQNEVAEASRESLSAQNHENVTELPYNSIEDEDKALARKRFYETIEDKLEPIEREFLRYMRLGIKDSEVFADVVKRLNPLARNIPNEIKNTKERLQRRIRALATELGYSPEDLL